LFTGAIVIIAIGVSVASGGTAAGGAVVVAKTTTVLGVEIAKGCLIAASAVGGASVAIAAYLALSSPEYCSLDVLHKAQKIQTGLKAMIRTGSKTQEELDQLHNVRDDVEMEYDYLADEQSCAIMREGLNSLCEFLDEYQKQGKSVVKSIHQAFDALRLFEEL